MYKIVLLSFIAAICALLLVFVAVKLVFIDTEGKYHPGPFVTLSSSGQYVKIKDDKIVHHMLSEKEEKGIISDEYLREKYIRILGVLVYDDERNLRIIWEGFDDYDPGEYYYRTWRGLELKIDREKSVIFADYLMYRLRLSEGS